MLEADGSQVLVEWSSAPDDAAVIGVALGLLAEDAPAAYLDGPADAAPTPEETAMFSASEGLRAHLLDHIVISQGGTTCDGRVTAIDDFIDDGARLAFDCPDDVAVVEVEVTMLLPIDDAYRTFGVSRGDASPDVAVFTADTPAHTWDFTADAGSRFPVAPAVVGALAAAGAVGGGLFGLRRRPGAADRERSPERGRQRAPEPSRR